MATIPTNTSFLQDFKGYYKDIIQAIDLEVQAINKDKSKEFEVYDGFFIHDFTNVTLYSFSTDFEINISADTPIFLVISDDEKIEGSFIGFENNKVYLYLQQHVGDSINNARVVSNPAFIYEKLKSKLLSFDIDKIGDLTIQQALMANLSPLYNYNHRDYIAGIKALASLNKPSLNPNLKQRNAIKGCISGYLHFVWGPPGTGKTSNLAQVARTINEAGESILVLTHSNAALDVAMMRIADAFEDTEPLKKGKIVRAGISHQEKILSYKEIIPEEILRRDYPGIIIEREELKGRRKRLSRLLNGVKTPEEKKRWADEFKKTDDKLKAVDASLKELKKKLYEDSEILGTTISKFIVDNSIYPLEFDTIIIDEASMAPFPGMLLASLKTKKRILFFGDYKQLPPIFLSNSNLVKWWFGRDVYKIAGVAGKTDDKRLTMLTTQYRMTPKICNLISELAYENLLETPPFINNRTKPQSEKDIFSGNSIIFFNTDYLHPVCFKEISNHSFSRVNLLHAALIYELSLLIKKNQDKNLGIISPYRLQSLTIYKLIQRQFENNITSATVHKFQGSERDVILFDITDASPQEGPSILTGKDPDLSLKLLNVACSRAKEKLFIVGSKNFIESRYPDTSVVRTILDYIKEFGLIVNVDSGIINSFISRNITWFDDVNLITDDLSADSFKENDKLIIDNPNLFKPISKFLDLLIELDNKGVKIKLFTNRESAEYLENTNIDLRLKCLTDNFFVINPFSYAYIGAGEQSGTMFKIKGKDITKFLTQILLGSELFYPAPDKEITKKLDELYGTCPLCGENRKPVKINSSRWIAGCPNLCRIYEELSLSLLQQALDLLKIDCLDCGNKVIIKQKGKRIYLSCSNYSKGCKGFIPKIEDIFGG